MTVPGGPSSCEDAGVRGERRTSELRDDAEGRGADLRGVRGEDRTAEDGPAGARTGEARGAGEGTSAASDSPGAGEVGADLAPP